MKLEKRFVFKSALLVILSVLLYISATFINSDMNFEMSTAMAGASYGIEGQMAPPWNLSNWIDGNGQKIEPIRLAGYRGKVVYLYFWQDW